jgi:hypothetical protein
MSNVDRLEFLDGIEAGLVSPSSGEPERRTSRRGGKAAKVIGGTMLASAAMMGMFGGVASAAEIASAAPANALNPCNRPEPIAQSQTKHCGTSTYSFTYQGNYSPNGIVRCFVFDLIIFNAPCGGTLPRGRIEACA